MFREKRSNLEKQCQGQTKESNLYNYLEKKAEM